MADHNKPTTTSTYADFVAELDARLDDLARLNDPAHSTVTNPPTNTIRWNSGSTKFEKWNGAAWADLSAGYTFTAVNATTLTASGVATFNGASSFNDHAFFNNGKAAYWYEPGTTTWFRTSSPSINVWKLDTSAGDLLTATKGVGVAVTGALSATASVSTIGAGLNTGPTSAGTSYTFALLRNAGGDFFVGKESSVGGTYFTGSDAYDSVLYSSTPIKVIVGGSVRGSFDHTGFHGASIKAGTGSATPSAAMASVSPSGTEASIEIYQTGVESWKLKNPASTTRLEFANSGITQMTLDGVGNFGLGVAPSAWRSADKALQVRSTVIENVNNTSAVFGLNYYRDSGGVDRYINSDRAAQIVLNNGGIGGIAFNTAPSGTAGNPITFTQAMTLDSTGLDVAVPIKTGKIISATVVNTTSGTGFTFTGIPAWAKRITVMFSGVLRTGTSLQVLRLGTSSGPETTGYKGSGIQLIDASSVNGALETSGFQIRNALAANDLNGCITISYIGSNTWAVQGALSSSVAAYAYIITGSKALAGLLDRITFTTVGGADAFTAGSINILYE